MSSNDIYPYQLMSMLARGEKVDIIDLRSKTNYNVGHISTAIHMSISTKKKLKQVHEAISHYNNPILYCGTGNHSKMIAEELRSKGIKCRILLGGFFAFFFEARLKAGMICNPFNLQPVEIKKKRSRPEKQDMATKTKDCLPTKE